MSYSEHKRDKIETAFNSLAVVASHFHDLDPSGDDADDYIETMMVVESLLDCGGVNHRDLVARFRRGRPTEIDGKIVRTGNRDQRTQMGKLRASHDPFYLAEDGVTNGAAMRMLGVALYFPGFEDMIFAANAVARITHATQSGRLAAVLVALRMRQAFMGAPVTSAYGRSEIGDTPNIHELRNDLFIATGLLGFREPSPVEQMLIKVSENRLDFGTPPPSIQWLADNIGFLHAATSSPVAAVAASYMDDETLAFLPEKSHQIEGISDTPPIDLIRQQYDLINADDKDGRACHPRHDADTFYSMLQPIQALAGFRTVKKPHKIFESHRDISMTLAHRW